MARLHELPWLQCNNYCITVDQFLENCLTVKETGLWAAGLMGMSPEESGSYTRRLVDGGIESGGLDFINTLKQDFQARGIDVSDHRIEATIERNRHHAHEWVSRRFWQSKSPEGGWERRRRSRLDLPPKPLSPILQEWKNRHASAC